MTGILKKKCCCAGPGQITGACCHEDGSCTAETAQDCIAMGGWFRGVNVLCADVICTPQTGQCFCPPDLFVVMSVAYIGGIVSCGGTRPFINAAQAAGLMCAGEQGGNCVFLDPATAYKAFGRITCDAYQGQRIWVATFETQMLMADINPGDPCGATVDCLKFCEAAWWAPWDGDGDEPCGKAWRPFEYWSWPDGSTGSIFCTTPAGPWDEPGEVCPTSATLEVSCF